MRKLLSSFSSINRVLIVVEINNKFHNPFIHHVPNRFYSVDPKQVPKPDYETVPYTKRTRFILPTITMERNKGLKQFEELKQVYEGKILPPTHPDSVRVTNILNNIIHALHREVEKMRSHNSKEYTGLRFLWLRMRRRLPPSLSHLDGLNWEALILSCPDPGCQSYTGGKIVLTTTFIEHITSDVEIATCIAHEVAHIVARHSAEKLTKILWVYVLDAVLNLFVAVDFTKRVSPLVERLPFNKRFEMEADYIGLLLMASAGYDPRQAPKVYENAEKIEKFAHYISPHHPPGKKRAEALTRPEIMEEALILYNVSARHGFE
ncbi:mitochondrial metalloendopeptidase OMA1 [Trifolium repens]|nr:mitochondrial metalloendopeptidase OMA1 [Trifolium repens]